jgi:hypothetical protein
MKNITITINVDDDYTKGCCWDCPFSYVYEDVSYDYEDGLGDFPVCIMGWKYDECKVVVSTAKEKNDKRNL